MKGEASPNVHSYHVIKHRDDKKYYVKEANGQQSGPYDDNMKAIREALKLSESVPNGRVTIHRDDGKILERLKPEEVRENYGI
jgi:hypothetical protein